MSALLEVQGLNKTFGGLRAVANVSFEIQEGGITGLIGPNGAGKSTLFDLLTGVQRNTSGRVRFRGREVAAGGAGWSPHRIASLGMSRTFQKVRVFPGMTVLANAMVGAFLHTASPTQAQARAEEALRMVDLFDLRYRSTRTLTLVDRKRLEIARALCTHPRLLLLDEVLSGLNSQEIAVSLQLIRRVNQSGVTLIVVEHLLRVIMMMSQRVLVMDYGELIADGSPEEVRTNPKVIKAYIGGAKQSHA